MWQQCEEQRQQHQQAGKSRQEKKAAQDEWRNTPQAKEHHKAMRKLARQRKRDQLLATLQEAETAAANKDSRHLYQYVRLLAPRHSRRRSASGDLIAPHEECAVLAKYARKLFAGRVFALPPLQPLPIEWFTPEAWRVSLGKLASRKAVLDDCASIDGWKQFSAEASTFLHEVSKVTISHPDPSLPPDWSKVQIAWLPKPSKSTASPENLRTIGLMGADTKAFIQILKQHAGSYVQRALQAVPQYAYRQQASTLDALLRASGHCRSVRSELAKQVDDVTARVLQQPMRELVGGLMISLDLSKAFDCLSYDEMYCSMQEIHIPEPLIRAIMHLHCNTMLTISHKGQSEEANYVQLRSVLRTNGPLSRERRIRVYAACVWTSILYGLIGIGVTRASLKILATTAAMHLRKVCRVHEYGVSNLQVLQRAGFSIIDTLQSRADQQLQQLTLDVQRDPAVSYFEINSAQQVHRDLQLLATSSADVTSSLQPLSYAEQVACPTCGVYFASMSGLNQHIHQRHPEIEINAKVDFDRSKHVLFGIPLCRRAGTLQQMINCWHQDGDIHALFEHGPLICLQLNRYLLGGKNMASVHFENAVQVPVFTQGLEVEWFAYKPVAGILHRGRLTESGHYQALLKVRHLWFQTEDHVCARPVAINAVQRSNIYVIWLMRSRAQASDQC
eukprot:s8592_g2.t1